MKRFPELRPYQDSNIPDELYCYMYKEMQWSKLYSIFKQFLKPYYSEFAILFKGNMYELTPTMRNKTYRKRRKGRKRT